MLEKQKLRQADVVASVLLILLGIATIVSALGMPFDGTYGGIPVTWYNSPGLLPVVLGAALILCSAGVLVRAWLAGGGRGLVGELARGLGSLARSGAARRILVVWVILLGYILCLGLHPFGGLGRLFEPVAGAPWATFLAEPEGANYVASSSIFLAIFMFSFYRPRAARWTLKSSLLILGLSLLMAWGTGYVFTQHLYSPLPW